MSECARVCNEASRISEIQIYGQHESGEDASRSVAKPERKRETHDITAGRTLPKKEVIEG